MRVVEIDKKEYQIKGLKSSDVFEGGLQKFGYNLSGMDFPTTPDGKVDFDKFERGIIAVIDAAMGSEKREAIENEHSFRGLRVIWRAICRETYGDKDEEKNFWTSGIGGQTKNEKSTVKTAKSAKKNKKGPAKK